MKCVSIIISILLAFSTLNFADIIIGENILNDTTDLIIASEFMQNEGLNSLKKKSQTLSVDIRSNLYNQYEKNVFISLGMNLILPTAGNWLAGDIPGGVVGLTGYILGFVCLDLSIACSGNYLRMSEEEIKKRNSISAFFGFSALAILASCIIYSDVSLIVYCNQYNNKLKDGLGLTAAEVMDNRHQAYSYKPIQINAKDELFNLNLMELEF